MVAEPFVEAGVVPPSHVLECCQLDLLDRLLRAMSVDQFGFVEPVHRLGEGMVIRVTDGPVEGFAPSSMIRSVCAIERWFGP